ncbi:AAA family ATPase AFG2 [Paramicrosporidium saccamoebae]|uniref:AAA family ATPase AFG2 n=1 Tax=Paramicrosporidium saccamoebae TaxID=1246581 RepID=A0A2H9TGI3_9FUNG|nr:AAA family ATPase AFG2 [Paramicrosporidium saccamoebae]
MTDHLIDQLSSLRLSSPSPTFTSQLKCKLNLSLPPKNAREIFRASMNPKEMTLAALSAGSLVLVNSTYFISVWPNPAVPPKNIRVSTIWGAMASLEDGSDVTVSPWCDLLPISKHLIVLANVSDKAEESLLVSAIRELPCIQTNLEYSLPIGTRMDRVTFRITAETSTTLHCCVCSKDTRIVVQNSEQKPLTNSCEKVDIGGLDAEAKLIMEAVQMSVAHVETLKKFKVRPPKGILLHGPPGTGKTLLSRWVASKLKRHNIVVNGAELLGKFYGESEAKLCDIFGDASRNAPSIIFIDELESLCPRRDSSSIGADNRMVATLLTLMDGLNGLDQQVFVLAATNSPDSIDPALRRPGRLDYEIEIGIPNMSQRMGILQALVKDHDISTACIEKISENAHGFVGADLSLVVKEATLIALQRDVDFELRNEDLYEGFGRIKPSAIREVVLEVPKVHWDQIGGQEATKQKLKESVEWPLKHPEKFLSFGIKPPKGVLLYGPPGCSKTLLAKALATESGLNFLAVKGPELFSKWVGDSEKAIHEIFRKARLAAPSDEFDAIGAKRSSDSSGSSVSDRVLSQILSEMDGADPLVNVTVVAATNRPDILVTCQHVYVSLPDLKARREIFAINARKMPFADSVNLDELAQKVRRNSSCLTC